MAKLGIETGADLAARDIAFLREHFGSFADYLYRAARGIDLRQVKADRPRKSIGAERTFGEDISSASQLRAVLDRTADTVWERVEKAGARGRTATLKLRYADFRTLTRARSLPQWIADKPEFAALGHALLDDLLPLEQPVRLLGLTLSALEQKEEDADGTQDGQLSLL
jgi:DNA polymerase-4